MPLKPVVMEVQLHISLLSALRRVNVQLHACAETPGAYGEGNWMGSMSHYGSNCRLNTWVVLKRTNATTNSLYQ